MARPCTRLILPHEYEMLDCTTHVLAFTHIQPHGPSFFLKGALRAQERPSFSKGRTARAKEVPHFQGALRAREGPHFKRARCACAARAQLKYLIFRARCRREKELNFYKARPARTRRTSISKERAARARKASISKRARCARERDLNF